MNNQYEEVSRTQSRKSKGIDIHEFSVREDGKTVLFSTSWQVKRNALEIGQSERRISNMGFQEVELSTGNLIFDWDPFIHNVLLNESCDAKGLTRISNSWDYLHVNSVDKNSHRDYLISGRHTSTVYKVSGEDGHVIWRLGGNSSDFVMEEGLPFHWQHHARFRFENETHALISLFDNASDDMDRNPSIPQARSVGKIIVLDTAAKPMTAKMLRRFDRPDGGRSPKLGSLQTIGDKVEFASVFVNWATQGYVSEYDAQNRLVLEAKFQSDRMSSYRAYKYPFVGKPTEPPKVKVLPIRSSKDEIASAFYVSWNGATEVRSWTFYGGDTETGTFNLLAKFKKHGFETSWVMPGLVKYAYVEAMDVNGKVIGKSATTTITPPIDGLYKIIAPGLEEAKTTNTTSSGSSQGASQETSLGSDFKLQSDQGQEDPATKALNWMPYVVVDGLALFGLYCVVRNITHHFIKRRNIIHKVIARQKGYKELSAFVPSP